MYSYNDFECLFLRYKLEGFFLGISERILHFSAYIY